MRQPDFSILSMLYTEEKVKLYEISKSLKLKSNDCILEYGVFFGGSLEALYLGLQENKTFNSHEVIGVDSFYASKKGDFYSLVIEYADKSNDKNKLEITYEYVKWYKYVQSSLSKYKNINLIKSLPNNPILKNTNHIALLHLDMPKHYKELRSILGNIINNIKSNTIIIFQDYFYHWSAEIIAFGFYLIKNDLIKLEYSCMNTLGTSNNAVSEKDLELFDAKINDKEYIFSLIVESIDYFKDKVNNHKLVILYMAAAQYAYVNKFNNKFDYYIQNINQMYSNDIKTRNLIDYMKHDVKKHNYDIYNIYSYSFDGF